jgi:Zn-dependent peptidase ImmA (M78 family)/transcriptional regulator with XRE-family HTH domain
MLADRLRLARASAGLPLRDLADRIGNLVSAQAIGKYERGEMMPGSKVVIALARALGVSEDYLLSSGDVELTDVEFRKHRLVREKEQAQLTAKVLTAVERYLEIEDILAANSFDWDQPRGFPFPVQSAADAENAASRLRALWDLGSDPIPALAEFLEERGIKVILVELAETISGMMCLIRRRQGADVPVIVVNERHAGERQRFTLAHELGHLLLEVAHETDHEKHCHRFAGAFLMPADLIWAQVGRRRSRFSLAELFQLKRLFGASIQAIVYRSKDLGILSEASSRELYRTISARGWRRQEPQPITPERPGRFRRLCFRALTEGVISEAKAAELLGMTVRQLDEELDRATEPVHA